MKYLSSKYTLYRGRLLSQETCKRFFKFASLPELKVCKTVGFILTVLF